MSVYLFVSVTFIVTLYVNVSLFFIYSCFADCLSASSWYKEFGHKKKTSSGKSTLLYIVINIAAKAPDV